MKRKIALTVALAATVTTGVGATAMSAHAADADTTLPNVVVVDDNSGMPLSDSTYTVDETMDGKTSNLGTFVAGSDAEYQDKAATNTSPTNTDCTTATHF